MDTGSGPSFPCVLKKIKNKNSELYPCQHKCRKWSFHEIRSFIIGKTGDPYPEETPLYNSNNNNNNTTDTDSNNKNDKNNNRDTPRPI